MVRRPGRLEERADLPAVAGRTSPLGQRAVSSKNTGGDERGVMARINDSRQPMTARPA
jgi:hypothetical protein